MLVAILAGLISTSATSSGAQQPDETTMALLGYISGMASTHYCACKRWPSSWNELRQFDDRMHAHSQSQGQKPVERIPWSTLSESRTATALEGHLSISVHRAGAAPIDIGVPTPDCSDFHPEVVVHLCATPK
jgi:hypothetical protein